MRLPFVIASLLALPACGNQGTSEPNTNEVTNSNSAAASAPKAASDGKQILNVEVIPHASQRYDTVGDYWVDDQGVTQFRISDLGNPLYHHLILMHELTEIELNKKAGVTIRMIDDFDFEFARNRPPDDASEPGDDPRAPYFKQHQTATKVERAQAKSLGVDWEAYEARIDQVMATYPTKKS
jgi:hypothetical protein